MVPIAIPQLLRLWQVEELPRRHEQIRSGSRSVSTDARRQCGTIPETDRGHTGGECQRNVAARGLQSLASACGPHELASYAMSGIVPGALEAAPVLAADRGGARPMRSVAYRSLRSPAPCQRPAGRQARTVDTAGCDRRGSPGRSPHAAARPLNASPAARDAACVSNLVLECKLVVEGNGVLPNQQTDAPLNYEDPAPTPWYYCRMTQMAG